MAELTPDGIVATLAPLAVPIDSVKPHPENVRRGDEGTIKASILARGQYQPIVVSRRTGYVIRNNHVWRVMKALGRHNIAATYVDVDQAEERELLLVDNATSDAGGYDNSRLAALLQKQSETPYGLTGTGYDADALEDVIARAGRVQETQYQQFAGDYAVPPATPAPANDDPVPAVPDTAERPRDILLMLAGPEHTRFTQAIKTLEAAYSTHGIAETVLQACQEQATDAKRGAPVEEPA